jgi:NAD(P)-dependent dehydrogenase (short-subunit alcohol dehydrogenase family)
VSWNPRELPGQAGTTFVVTGANAGLGFFTAEQIASTGAHVILACRNPAKTDAALGAIRSRVPGASVSGLHLDVSDLASVRAAAEQLLTLPRLDGLILNAGMVHPPRTRELSVDGHELVLATNHLGHFALTALVMPALERTHGARIVALGSMISRLRDSDLADLQVERGYSWLKAYAQSKIAVQVFGFELDRRLRARSAGTKALVAHPGYSISGLTPRIAGVNEPSRGDVAGDRLQGLLGAQGKDQGAWPAVRAALDPHAQGGQYYGPRRVLRGQPVLAVPSPTSLDSGIAGRLWTASERLTGARFLSE